MRRSLIILLLVVGGCDQGSAMSRKEIVPLDQVPQVVMEAAKAKLPDIKFDSALKKPDGVYEVRGKSKNGKILEVEVSESGEVLAVE